MFEVEDLNQVLHCVHQTDSALSIWWVDDCFTNTQINPIDGGFLPIEAVREKMVHPNKHHNSGWIYEKLLKIAQEEKLNFYVCSFEYAEANWEQKLNSPRNVVLLDIGYQGKGPEEDTYGVSLFFRLTNEYPLRATVTFLTVLWQRVTEWIRRNQTWLPGMPFPIVKEIQGRLPEQEILALVQYFKAHQPKRASEWSLETWRVLRKKAREVCSKLGENGVGHSEWAHHLPCGGSLWSNPGDSKNIKPFTQSLRAGLKTISPDVEKLPDHCWENIPNEDIPGWDRPPIRALAQIDGMGKDLTAILYMLEQDIHSISGIKLSILFPPREREEEYPLKHDFLWFNGCALANGLHTLAKSFAHEVWKVNDGQPEGPDFPNWQWTGRIFWHVGESFEDETLGLHIQIHQDLTGWNRQRDKERPSFVTKPFPLPAPSEAKKKVHDAYELFRQAGADIQHQSDGSLFVRIPARKIPRNPSVPNDVIWEV